MKCTVCNTNKPVKGFTVCNTCLLTSITQSNQTILKLKEILEKQEKTLIEQNQLLLQQQAQIKNMLQLEDSLINYFSEFLEQEEIVALFQNLCDHRHLVQ